MKPDSDLEPSAGRGEGFDWLEPTHSLGERLPIVSDALRQALAWNVAAELVRRHPKTLRLSMAFIHQYGPALLPMKQRPDGTWRPLHLMTWGLGNHITPTAWVSPGGTPADRFNWLDVLLAPNRRDYVVAELERQAGLRPPAATPPTTRRSVGVRFVATFLARTALAPTMGWVVANGLIDDDDGTSTAQDLFNAIPSVREDWESHDRADAWSTMRYWFVLPNEEESSWYSQPPVAAIDFISGRLWSAGGECHDLMAGYATSGRRLDPLVSRLLPPTQ